MLVSAIGYLNQKGIKSVEDCRVQSGYDKASLFGQIEHNPVDFVEHKANNIFLRMVNMLAGKKEITQKQALDMLV